MVWLFWIGTALVALMSLSCGVTLSAKVGKGELVVWKPAFFGWIVGCHGGLGVLALYLMTLAR